MMTGTPLQIDFADKVNEAYDVLLLSFGTTIPVPRVDATRRVQQELAVTAGDSNTLVEALVVLGLAEPGSAPHPIARLGTTVDTLRILDGSAPIDVGVITERADPSMLEGRWVQRKTFAAAQRRVTSRRRVERELTKAEDRLRVVEERHVRTQGRIKVYKAHPDLFNESYAAREEAYLPECEAQVEALRSKIRELQEELRNLAE